MISLEEIKEKQKELNKMIEEYNKQNLKLDKNWKPKHGEEFYYIDIYNEVDCGYNENSCDEATIEHKRVFHTEEQAKKWLEIDTYLREKSFEPNWKDYNQEKWNIYYDYTDNKFYNNCLWTNSNFAPFYFESEEIVNEIFEKYNEEELKFYFNIGE